VPDEATHLGQARHNEGFFGKIDHSQDGDWAVTVLFYAALHYVDAYLARTRMHPANHSERGRMIHSTPTVNAVRNHYRRLEDSSVDARYSAHIYPPREIDVLRRQDFEPLKRALTA
jgi:hypothetical protein